MKSPRFKVLASALLAVLACFLLAGASSPKKGPLLQPDKLIIESTTDVRGKTSPCG